MDKRTLKNDDNIFKIDTIDLNIFSDTYQKDYVNIEFDIYNDDDYVLCIYNKFNISYQLFDFLHKTNPAETNKIEFTIEDINERIKYGIEDKIEVYNSTFENSGIGVLSLYEAIFKVNYIDRDKWEKFLHAVHLTENELVLNAGNTNIDNQGIFDYESCFKKTGNNYEINYRYVENRIEFLDSPSILSTNSYTYVLNNTKELIISFLCNFFRNNPNKTIKKCEHCGKWFVPDKRTTKYCDRLSPKYKNKTCKEAAVLINKLLNEKSNEVKYLRKKIRMKYYNPVNNYGKQKDIERLEKFDNEDEVWQNKLARDEVTKTQYKNWLNSHYVRKQVKGG